MTAFDPMTGQAPTPMTPDEKNLCILIHLLGIFTGFLGPLIIWLLKKDESQAVRMHALEALNFAITISIAVAGCVVLSIVFIGVLLLPLVLIYATINFVLGAIAASKGEFRAYPLTLRLLK